MDEVKEMLKAVINGQHALKAELLGEIGAHRQETKEGFAEVDKKFAEVDKKFDEVNMRLDKQGAQLSYLEDDAPTREEHDNLGKRVEKLEHTLPA
jgi:predicted nuclease with TOPRIM domain